MEFNSENVSNGYLECMGEEFFVAVGDVCKAWQKWKNGPATETEDWEPAREEVLYFINQMLK